MAYRVTTGRFVGRTNQLARLHQLLARAGDGQPLVAVVGGEAGVGKTRLVEQLAATARERGVRVLDGGCVPLGEEGLPFAPVTQALRGLADLDPAELQAVAGPAQAELGRLLPDLAWGGEAAADPAVVGAGQGRLFELDARQSRGDGPGHRPQHPPTSPPTTRPEPPLSSQSLTPTHHQARP